MRTKYKILLARLAYRAINLFRTLLRKGTTVQVSRGGLRWSLELKEGIDLSIYLQGQFEPSTSSVLATLVKPGQTILDIGANIGAHTLRLGNLVGPTGTVVAFEPTRYAYQKLLTNLSLNPDLTKQVVPEQIMLGREDAKDWRSAVYSSWTIVGDANRHPKHLGELKSTEGCDLRRLDSYLAEHDYKKIDLIKMDVDGNECDVLRGGEEALGRDHPVICLELAPYILAEKGASIDELLEILARHNYRIYRESDLKELPMEGALLERLIGDGAGINAVAKCP